MADGKRILNRDWFRTGEALDSRDCIPNSCESDPEPVGEALDSRDCIANGCESDPESGRAKHWIVGIASRMVVNHPMLLPYQFNPQS